MKSTFSTVSKAAFFNVHTEALGYLTGITERSGKNGQFVVASFRMQEGHRDKLDYTFVTLTIAQADDAKLLMQYAPSANAKVPVFAGLRLAGLKATPFVYPSDSPKAGQLGVNYSAKLVKVIYLKVGDTVVKQTDTPSAGASTEAPQPVVARHSTSAIPDLTVNLAKDHPAFEAEKSRLLQAGYRWHSQKRLWVLKAVPNGVLDAALLTEQGYVFKGDFWSASFPVSQARV
jgi:hypothetical protein